jgi:hypothetical protein
MSFETEKLVENLAALIAKVKSHKKNGEGKLFFEPFKP